MNGADAIVKCLQAEGTEYVFGYPGVAICPFYNSILDSEIRTILVRQEQNAAHIASGFSRITGKTGVVAVTSGPGATNLITGIATAYADSIPMICITGQVDSRLMGSDVFQEADISGACESFVKYSYIVRDAKDIPKIFKEAFYIASTGRKGPVLIDVPIDIQQAPVRSFSYPEEISIRSYKPTVKGHAVQIRKVIGELEKAKKPIICVGGGAHLSGAAKEIRTFAEKNNIPVVSTMMGLSVMPTAHPNYFGMVGNNGQSFCNRAMNDADVIIMAGARVADRSISQPDLITSNKVLVHIDVDPAEIGKNAGPNIPIVGDLTAIFAELNKEEISIDDERWMDYLRNQKKQDAKISAVSRAVAGEKRSADEAEGTAPVCVDPKEFIRRLSSAMEDNAIYVADVGQNQLWSCANAVIRNGRFMTSGGMGTMGYALPAAMGAKIAGGKRQVVAVCGDGGFQMTMMELATARQYGIQIKLVVLKNNVLGLVRQYQHFNYHDSFSVIDLSGSPELDKIAEAYGMDYMKLSDEPGMSSVIEAFLADKKSVLLEVSVDPDEIA